MHAVDERHRDHQQILLDVRRINFMVAKNAKSRTDIEHRLMRVILAALERTPGLYYYQVYLTVLIFER